ncbi:hypothetical protein RRG08_032973 [Elysia crispata]|uniref:Uncharacterized protein n=1 Tax=Elysia crispata TaxID=231223 RepID=A0AAE0YS51_9GAST|nr:hypothetical protein RRG08_032973 [Elysia crispata]
MVNQATLSLGRSCKTGLNRYVGKMILSQRQGSNPQGDFIKELYTAKLKIPTIKIKYLFVNNRDHPAVVFHLLLARQDKRGNPLTFQREKKSHFQENVRTSLDSTQIIAPHPRGKTTFETVVTRLPEECPRMPKSGSRYQPELRQHFDVMAVVRAAQQ